MNTLQVEGTMNQLNGKIKQVWGKLTDNDIMLYNGKREQFLGKLKEHYGLTVEDAEKKIKAIEDDFHSANGNISAAAAKPATKPTQPKMDAA